VYRIRPGFGAVRAALRCHGNREHVVRELGSLVLVELEVRVSSGFDLGRMHQPGSSNVPYAERYFSLDRQRLLGEFPNAAPGGDFVVAFFLHGFDEQKPLQAPWGIVPLPRSAVERPAHLRELEYVYYD
jgi:hypothetical protein